MKTLWFPCFILVEVKNEKVEGGESRAVHAIDSIK